MIKGKSGRELAIAGLKKIHQAIEAEKDQNKADEAFAISMDLMEVWGLEPDDIMESVKRSEYRRNAYEKAIAGRAK